MKFKPFFHQVHLTFSLAFLLTGIGLGEAPVDKSSSRHGDFNLPSAGGSVKGGAGTVNASAFTGTLSYGFDITVPKGPGGFGPQPRLSYSSVGGSGPFALGWGLTGFQPIQYDLSKGIPTYEYNDEGSPTGPLLYGERLQRDMDAAGIVFRLERESSFTTIVYHPEQLNVSGQTFAGGFVVHAANGVKTYFLNDSCSVKQPVEDLNSDCSSVPLTKRITSWMPRFKVDPSGNTIEYQYKLRKGELLLDKISYGTNRIEVNYFDADRPDKLVTMNSGFEQHEAALAGSITTYHGSQILRRYCLRYRSPIQQDERSIMLPDCAPAKELPNLYHQDELLTNTVLHLEAVYEYGGEGEYKKTKARAGERYFGYSPWFDVSKQPKRPYVFPVDGLKKTFSTQGQSYFLDINQDSLPDLVRSISKLKYSQNKGQTAGVNPIDADVETVTEIPNIDLESKYQHLADINGDGIVDYFRVNGFGFSYQAGIPNTQPTGPRFKEDPVRISFPPGWSIGSFGTQAVRIVDINGDRLDDLIRFKYQFGTNWVEVLWNKGNNTFESKLFPTTNSQKTILKSANMSKPGKLRLKDMNGDGLPDFVYLSFNSIRIWYNTGAFHESGKQLFAAPSNTEPAPNGGGVQIYFNKFLGHVSQSWILDANGDGLQDFLTVDKGLQSKLHVYLGLATGKISTLPDFTLLYGNSNTAFQSFSKSEKFLRILDVDGDGFEEIVFMNASKIYMVDFNRLPSGNSLVKPGLLDRVSEEDGLEVEIGYTTAEAESERTGRVHPIPVPKTLVKRVVQHLPQVKPSVQELLYNEAFYDRERRKVSGFGKVTSVTVGESAAETLVETSLFHRGSEEDGGYTLAGQQKASTSHALSAQDSYWSEYSTRNWQFSQDIAFRSSLVDDSRNQPQPAVSPKEQLQTKSTYLTKSELGRTLVCPEVVESRRIVDGQEQTTTETMECDQYGNTISKIRQVFKGPALVEDLSFQLTQKFDFSQVHSELHDQHIFDRPSTETQEGHEGLLHKTSWIYNKRGLAESTKQWIDQQAGIDRYQTTTTTFDPFGNIASVQDSLGHTTHFTYHLGTLPLKATDALGYNKEAAYLCTDVSADFQQHRMTCLDDGRPKRLTDENGVKTLYEYDSLGRISRVLSPQGPTEINYEYKLGSPTQWNRALARHTLTSDGANFHQLTFASPDGVVVAHISQAEVLDDATNQPKQGARVQTYTLRDRSGRDVEVFHPFFVSDSVDALFQKGTIATPTDVDATTIRYDAFGRVMQRILPTGTVETFSRDLHQESKTIQYETPGAGTSIVTIIDGIDALGRKISFQDGEKNKYLFKYDPANRLTEVHDPAGNISTSTWNGLDLRTEINSPSVGTITYEYNELGQLILKEVIGLDKTSSLGVETFTYDAIGRIKANLVDNSPKYEYSYDTPSPLPAECAGAKSFPIGHPSKVTTHAPSS